MEFAAWMAEQPQQVKDEAQGRVDAALGRAEFYARGGVLDGFCLCSDCCFNDDPFFSPTMFEEFVWPYLSQLIAGYRELGFYVIKHTDGNIMPILEALVAAGPHAVDSLDPQGGVDLAEVKRRVGRRVCLIGNVSCAVLDTGSDEEVVASVRYALRHGMPGGGYFHQQLHIHRHGLEAVRADAGGVAAGGRLRLKCRRPLVAPQPARSGQPCRLFGGPMK